METITLQELLEATGGSLLTEPDDSGAGAEGLPEAHTEPKAGAVRITGVQSDNRLVQEGDAFFAFVGEKTDGHRFVNAALEAGAVCAVVSERPTEYLPGKIYVLTEDTVAAFGALAGRYRARFSIPVIGVTGSVGKTTTKDMIAAVLSERYRTQKTQGNFNNNIGLPRTLFTLTGETEAAVVEMGMNHLKEISYLVHIAQPETAVITNIGDAHIGNLGSKENIFRAKCEIFEGLREGGYAVLNGDDPYLVRLREDEDKNARFVLDYVGESPDCAWRAADVREDGQDSMRFTAVTPLGTFEILVPALGHHMIYPALTAAAVGARYGLTAEEIRRGIARYVPTAMRMETLHLPGEVILYNDTYNANPQSMKAGLLTLARTKADRHVAVLGDMKELGASEEALHREVGAYAASLHPDELVTVGEAAALLAEEAQKEGLAHVHVCRSKEEAKEVIRQLAGERTAWLFKASRSMAFEELAHYAAGIAGQEKA